MKNKTFLLIITALLLSNFSYAQYDIKVTIKNLKNSDIYLGYHFGKKKYIYDTASVNDNGYARFQSQKPLSKGIYFILLPSDTYFDFIIDTEKKFSIKTDTANFIRTLKFENSEANNVFIEYQRYMIRRNIKEKSIIKTLNKYKNIPDSVVAISSRLEKFRQKTKDYKNKIMKDNKSQYFSKIIKAMTPVEIPEPNPDIIKKYNNKDSINHRLIYVNRVNHYFDNIDFKDENLLRTSIIPLKIDQYFKKIVIPDPDSIIKACFNLIERTRYNKYVYRYVINYLLKKFEKSGDMPKDKVFIAIADNYYLKGKTPWVNKKFLNLLAERVKLMKPLQTGDVIPNMHFKKTNDSLIKLHEFKSTYTVLFFYDIDCHHCERKIPIINKTIEKYPDITFLGIYYKSDYNAWLDYIEEKNIKKWINLGKANPNADITDIYDLFKIPRIFIVDEEMKIIEKDIEAEQIEEKISELLKQ